MNDIKILTSLSSRHLYELCQCALMFWYKQQREKKKYRERDKLACTGTYIHIHYLATCSSQKFFKIRRYTRDTLLHRTKKNYNYSYCGNLSSRPAQSHLLNDSTPHCLDSFTTILVDHRFGSKPMRVSSTRKRQKWIPDIHVLFLCFLLDFSVGGCV